jgi:5-methylthioadenosine/S-adenosylhomocysteine deaminase
MATRRECWFLSRYLPHHGYEMTARLFLPDVLLFSGEPRYGWALLARDGRVGAVGPAAELTARYRNVARVPLPGMALMPGTVNAHSHAVAALWRGLINDQPLPRRRDLLARLAPRLDEEGAYTGALLAFAEMLLHGITTVCDFFPLHHGGNERALAVARAAREVGIRLVLARGMADEPAAPHACRETPAQAAENTRTLAAALQGDPLVSVIPAPHSPRAASAEMVRTGARLAAELDTPWHIHVAETPAAGEQLRRRTGRGPLAWLADLGVLDARARIVHGVWLDRAEIWTLAKAGGGLVHCPGADLFRGAGVAPLALYRRAGVTVALGSGAPTSRVLSVFEEMRLAAALQKGLSGADDAVTALEVYHWGTRGGAHATGLPVGELAPGRHADLLALDLHDLSLQPPHDLVRNLVYVMQPTAIRHVWVHGEPVVRDGRLVRVSAEHIRQCALTLTRAWLPASSPRSVLPERPLLSY